MTSLLNKILEDCGCDHIIGWFKILNSKIGIAGLKNSEERFLRTVLGRLFNYDIQGALEAEEFATTARRYRSQQLSNSNRTQY